MRIEWNASCQSLVNSLFDCQFISKTMPHVMGMTIVRPYGCWFAYLWHDTFFLQTFCSLQFHSISSTVGQFSKKTTEEIFFSLIIGRKEMDHVKKKKIKTVRISFYFSSHRISFMSFERSGLTFIEWIEISETN